MKIISSKTSKNEIRQQVIDEQSEFDAPTDVLASWKNKFKPLKEDIESSIKGLRNPQIGGLFAVLSHWTCSNSISTVVMPTGTGKTETMLSILVHERLPQLLIIVPTDPLRTQLSNKFLKLGLLQTLNLLDIDIKFPIVGTVKTKFSSANEAKGFFEKCNVIVATASILASFEEDILDELINSCTHLFIDEAHHSEAKTWYKFREKLSSKKIVQFTATPFRNDKKKIEGKIIFNFPLKKAQEEGYFKPINFLPIYEYDVSQKDKAIANKAVEILRRDIQTYPHILLARVRDKERANQVFAIYQAYTDLRVVKIHSGMKVRERRASNEAILARNVDVIVCVDMLGEGFDLPQLKIAAFHDIRKSLPITLQFVGRITRTQYDQELGNATIVVNLANIEVSDELAELYSRDPDWNKLLPQLSENRTQEEIDLYNFMEGFQNNDDFPLAIQSLKPALSTVIYKNRTAAWFPTNYQKGIGKIESYELVRHNLNSEEKVLVIITAKKIPADWVDNESVSNLSWSYYVVYWETFNNLLFIHSSDKSSVHKEMAHAIIGENAELISGDNGGHIFKIFSGIKRFKLQNVGLTEVLGKLIRFVMRVGSDIEPALSRHQISRAKKAMIFGTGYENGVDVSIGCSYKGRIWSRRRNNIPTFIKWCKHIGKKVIDENINANEVLRDSLVAKALHERPELYPVFVDWGEEIYKQSETKFSFEMTDGTIHELYNVDLVLIEPQETGIIKIGIKCKGEIIVEFELDIFSTENDYSDFKFVNHGDPVFINYGTKRELLEKYFYKDTPVIWFANGDYLEGNNHIEMKSVIEPYNAEDIEIWEWTGIDISSESQGVNPKKTDSIQYHTLRTLERRDYDIIFDDDGSGEIADIITIKKSTELIEVEFYHLKYAHGGRISRQMSNLYEVCGQAQKSVVWQFKKNKEFLEHLLRRETKRYQGQTCSRFEKGDKNELTYIIDLVSNRVPMSFKIYIVQPGISASDISDQQLTLLGVTETYLKERALLDLKVIGSA